MSRLPILLALGLFACNGGGGGPGDDGGVDDTGMVGSGPELSLTAPEETPFGAEFTIDVGITSDDPDGVTLEVSADDAALFPDGSFEVEGSGDSRTITGISAEGQVGLTTLTVTATDAAGQTGSATVELDVYVNRTATGVQFFGTGSSDFFLSAEADDAGNVYACGYFGLGPVTSAQVHQINVSGGETWTASLEAVGGNIGRQCRVTGDSQVAFATQLKPTEGSNQQQSGLYTFNATGAPILGLVQLTGGNESYGKTAAIAPDGSVYLLSLTDTNLINLRKYSATGIEEWSRDVASGGGSSTRAGTLYIAPDGKLWVTGFGNGTLNDSEGVSYIAQAIDGLLAVYDPDGTLEHFELLGGVNNDYLNAVAVGEDGVYLVGATQSVLTGTELTAERDWFVQKRTDVATVAWTAQGAPSNQDLTSGNDIAIGHDGTVYITGYAGYVDGSNAKSFVASIDPTDGSENYAQVFGQTARFTASVGIAYSGRDLVIAGSTNGTLDETSPEFGGTDAFLGFLDPTDGSFR